jgi:hypothetical protein
VLQADDAAQAASGGAINSVYYEALWSGTESLTRSRINAASLATASLVYTAWINAGQPPVPGSGSDGSPGAVAPPHLEANPSPFHDALSIGFGGAGPLSVDVFDVRGSRVQRVVHQASGPGSVSWRPDPRVGPGLYFVRLSGSGLSLVRRVTRIQ